jgi:hypothetical protein
MLAARLGIGALGVGFETPEDTAERVSRYLSEAASYFEYTLDVAMRAQRG